MILSLFHYLRGVLLLRLEGPFLERFLNLCVRDGIYLWNIRKKGETVSAFVSLAGFRRMRNAARKTKTRVRIHRKCGLPLFLHRHRKRRAFAVGMLLFFLVLALLSSFIWAIEIDGNEKIEQNVIRNTLKSCGLEIGVVKYKIKESAIKEEMLRQIPELGWLWVEVRGTKALVHVREKTAKPEMTAEGQPANISAKKDGVIVSVTATRGKPLVEPGDVVQKGALLISGTVETKLGGTLLVRSAGEVRAKTWYSASGTFPCTKIYATETGARKTRYALHLGAFRLPLYSKAPFANFTAESDLTSLHLWGDLYLPVQLETETYVETKAEEKLLSAAEAETLYGNQLVEDMALPDSAEVIKTEFSHILEEDGTIRVSATVECIEEIGEIHEILEGKENDREIF